MNPQAAKNLSGGRLPELDGLRAVAILLVLAYHALPHVPVRWIQQDVNIGWVGVDLFFVLSGFLIGGTLLDHRAAPNYYSVFFARRFFRIVPLYALVVAPGLLVVGLGCQRWFAGHSLANQPTSAIWFCPFFLQNVAVSLFWLLPKYLIPTWSVAVEEQFYLLLPPLVRRLKPRQLRLILGLGILSAPVFRGGLLLAFGERAQTACYVLLPCRWDSLLLGAAAALAFRDGRRRQWLAGHRRGLHYIWGGAGAAAALLAWHSPSLLNPVMAVFGYTVFDFFFAATLLLAVLNPHGGLHRVLRQPFFKPIATVSYGLYLLHSPMLAVCESLCRGFHITYAEISWTATGVVAVSLTATALAAAASWYFFERRFLLWGRRYQFQSQEASSAR